MLSFDSGSEADQNRQSCFIRLPAAFSELHIDVTGFDAGEPVPEGMTDGIVVKGEIHAVVDGDRSFHLASPALLLPLQGEGTSRSLNPFARRADTPAPSSAAHIRAHVHQQVASAFDAAMGQYMMARGSGMATPAADDAPPRNPDAERNRGTEIVSLPNPASGRLRCGHDRDSHVRVRADRRPRAAAANLPATCPGGCPGHFHTQRIRPELATVRAGTAGTQEHDHPVHRDPPWCVFLRPCRLA